MPNVNWRTTDEEEAMSYLSAVCLFSRNMRLYLGYLAAIGVGAE